MKFRRDIYYYKSYFQTFYNKQHPDIQKKIDWVIGLVRDLEIIPEKYFKHIEGSDGLYEIRVKVSRSLFRIFCFFDEGRLIIILHGFQKKSAKTPRKEIEKAKRLMEEYYNEKE